MNDVRVSLSFALKLMKDINLVFFILTLNRYLSADLVGNGCHGYAGYI